MLIRGQDKKTIVNLDNITQICFIPSRNAITAIFVSGAFEDLGKYTTTDKTEKVLDMIEKKYSSYLYVAGGPALVRGGIDVQPAAYNIPKTFHMPQDDEVDV